MTSSPSPFARSAIYRLLQVAVLLIACMALAQARHQPDRDAFTRKIATAAWAQAGNGARSRVFVLLHESTSAPRERAALLKSAKVAAVRAQVSRDIDDVLVTLPPASRARVLRRFALLRGFVIHADRATLERLARHPRVSRIDPDTGGGGHAAPDAASALNRVDLLAGLGISGAGMKVAVIDSGIDTDHPDFAGRIVGQQCFCSIGTGCCPNGTAQQSGPGSAEDDHGHGTNVAGIIGGNGGIAPRGALPQVELVAVKVIDRNNRFCCASDIVAALDWLAVTHPDIDAVNLSLGTDTRFPGDCDNSTSWTQALSQSIANLDALGAVVTSSSGNQADLNQMGAPACVSRALSVAATWDFSGGARTFLGCSESATSPKQPTCFSNRSSSTDLFAAGAFVTATGFNGSTSTFGGTSQAAPMAAACAAAAKIVAPASTVSQRIEAIRLSPSRIDDTASGRNYPFLDCRDALSLLSPTIDAPLPAEGSQPLLRPRN